MKKRIRTNRLHRYILASGLIMVSFGIWISCSKDASVSSIAPTSADDSGSGQRLVGTKPAVGGSNYADFHPQTGVNYDPFANMTLEERRTAIGGPDAAEKYLRIMAKQLARVMADAKTRTILHSVVPDLEQGEIHISKIADEFPQFLEKFSDGFRDAVANGAISGNLANLIKDDKSDSKTIYKASKALFELEIAVSNPPGKTWNPAQPIPVFFAPIDDESATVIEGIDTNLQSISVPAGGDTAPYTCLVLNFDEDLPLFSKDVNVSSVPQHESLWTWQNILNSFSLTSPAYAHYPPSPFDDDPEDPHDPCYGEDIIAPVDRVVMYYDHEDWPMGAPEIFMGIIWRQVNEPVEPYRTTEEQLEDLDEENVWYTDFADLRARHGTCGGSGTLEIVYIEEMDPWGADDLGRWTNVTIPTGGATPNRKDLTTNDVRLRIRRTTDDT
ncbi:MAG: hypothetical protein F4W91_12940 [Gemmatimonadetes bacterium]|nr:hypothetical protein [Gemmatimonadota bacterium]